MSKKYHSFYENLHVHQKLTEIQIQIVSELKMEPQSSNNVIHLWIPKEFAETPANFEVHPDGFKLIDQWFGKYADFKNCTKIEYITHTLYKLPWYTEYEFERFETRAYFAAMNGLWFVFDDFIENIYKSSSVHVDFLVAFLKTVANMYRGKGAAKVNEWCTRDISNDLANEADCFMSMLEEFSVLAYAVYDETVAHLLDDVFAKVVDMYIELEIPCYRNAILKKRHLNDEEWRQKRWMTAGLPWLSVLEFGHMQFDLKYYNCYDSTTALLCQLAILWNDIYSYPKDSCTTDTVHDNRVQQLMHEKNQTMIDAMHSVANQANEMMSLFMGIYNNSPKQLRPFLFIHMRVTCYYPMLYVSMSRYGWEGLPNKRQLDKNVSYRD